MCRGYAAAVAALEDAHAEADAYQVGRCPRTGLAVAIGHRKAGAARLVEDFGLGESAIWLSPDEVATLLARVAALKPIVTIKRKWPGAEITDTMLGDQPINQFDQPIPADDALEDDL